jgi:flagellar protein FliL
MPANRQETTAAPNGAAKTNAAAEDTEAVPAAAPTGAKGGFKAWLPLIVTMAVMPALAYVTTTFVLVPKLKKASGQPTVSAREETSAPAGEGGAAKGHADGNSPPTGPGKVNYPFGKVLVNVSASLGTRYLLASLTLVGVGPDFKTKMDDHKDQLLDLAAATLSAKTIADLEKPGARNLIRTELISVFNTALGKGIVQEIYFTEFAIQ